MTEDQPGIQIRVAGPDDAPSVAAALRQSFGEYKSSYTEEAFAATTPTSDQIAYRMNEGPVWVAILNHSIVGTVSAVPQGEALYIRSMAVLPAARGRQVGGALLTCVERFALAQGHRRLFLTTTPFLRRAIRLYERMGYRRSGEGPHDLFGTPLFTMEKEVAASGVSNTFGEAEIEPMMRSSSDNVALIERFYRDLWNRFDKTLIPVLLTEDLEFRGSLGHDKLGHGQFAEYMDFIKAAFPDFTNTVEEVVSEGNRSFASLTYRGTHRGELLGIPATGRQVEYAGAARFRFREGRIAAVWVLGDVFGLWQQLSSGPA